MSEPQNIERLFEEWWSPSLGRDMEILRYGYSGTPILGFPGNMGRYYDWENHQLIDALRLQLHKGYNQIFCIDSVDTESVLNTNVDPQARIARYKQYMTYVVEEVIPYIFDKSNYRFLIATGFNTGALHAMNLALQYPDKVNKLVAMSGVFSLGQLTNDPVDKNSMRYSPLEFVAHPSNNEYLSKLGLMDIRLAASRSEPEFDQTEKLSQWLKRRMVTHHYDVWEDESLQDWDLWGEMLKLHIP